MHTHTTQAKNRWEYSLAAGWWRPVSALPAVSRDYRLDVKRDLLAVILMAGFSEDHRSGENMTKALL